MAVPFDRKITFSTYVVPEVIYTETLEEGTEKTFGTIFNVAEGGVGKALGSRSRGGECQIGHNQGSDSWTSFQVGTIWENIPDNYNWEDYLWWHGVATTIEGSTSIRPKMFGESVPARYIFVKNVGDYDLKISLDGGSTYPIELPPFSALSCRLNGINGEDIILNKVTNNTLAEFLVAK